MFTLIRKYKCLQTAGEFDFVEDRDEEGVIHRVYTPLGKKNDGLYALSVQYTSPFSLITTLLHF